MSGWARPCLADISESVEYGLTASADTSLKAPKFLRITDIQDGNVDWASVPGCPCSGADVEKYGLRNGDIVFARTGATTGKSFLIDNAPAGAVFASYLIRVRPSKKLVEPRYLAHFFNTADYWHQVSMGTTGTTQPGVNGTKLKELAVPLPPLPEQKRIAAILDKADAIRRKRQEAIRLTEQLLRSAFLEMFGDPVTNPKGWEVKELNEFISPERPITYGILKPGPDQDGGVPYVRVVDIQDGEVRVDGVRRTSKRIDYEYRRSRLRAGDLLMSIRGHVGRLAIVPSELDGANITQDTARLAPVGLDSHYLMNLVQTSGIQSWMQRHVRGVAVRGINIGDVRRIPVPVPPKDRQLSFARLASTTLHDRALGRVALAETEHLANSLTQRAFLGRL